VCGSAHSIVLAVKEPFIPALPKCVPSEYYLLQDVPLSLLRYRMMYLYHVSSLIAPFLLMLPHKGSLVSYPNLKNRILYSVRENTLKKVRPLKKINHNNFFYCHYLGKVFIIKCTPTSCPDKFFSPKSRFTVSFHLFFYVPRPFLPNKFILKRRTRWIFTKSRQNLSVCQIYLFQVIKKTMMPEYSRDYPPRVLTLKRNHAFNMDVPTDDMVFNKSTFEQMSFKYVPIIRDQLLLPSRLWKVIFLGKYSGYFTSK
jgi:hypothetical protein